MWDSQTHDNKGAPAYLVGASSQAALGAVLTNALKELGVSEAIDPRTSTDVTTPDGSVRVLMTSLLDAAHYPAADFGALYHRRWRVEEAFKRLKHRLRLEAPTGLTHLAFQQDFAAKILADNLHSLLAEVASTEPVDEPAHQPNRSYAIGTLKPIFAGCLLQLTHCLSVLPAALAAIAKARCRVQPNRHYPRPSRPKPHSHLTYKLAC